jgi:transposase
MTKFRSMLANQSSVGEPERRGDERSETARSGGSSTLERAGVPVPPESEVPARRARRRFTTAYKLAILRQADACTGHGELGALLRKEGLYSSHVVTWRRQREHGLTPKTRGRKKTAVDPRVKKLEQENRRLTSRLQQADAVIAFQKKVSELLGIPLKPFVRDEDD